MSILPYVISVLVGVLVFWAEKLILNPNVKDLIVNISAGLISVPFIFISYELVKSISEKQIRERVSHYIDYNTERVLFDVLKYLYQWFYPSSKSIIAFNNKKVDELFDLQTPYIEKFLSEQRLLGFFIFKDISMDIDVITTILKSPIISKGLNSQETIYFMDILRNIIFIKKETQEFISEGGGKGFKVKDDLNPDNPELELFYKNVKIDTGIYNDIEHTKLLEYFRVPTEAVERLSSHIVSFLNDCDKLLELREIDFWSKEYPYGLTSPNIKQ